MESMALAATGSSIRIAKAARALVFVRTEFGPQMLANDNRTQRPAKSIFVSSSPAADRPGRRGRSQPAAK